MNPISALTDDIFAAFLKCQYKAYLKLQGAVGEPSEYERLQTRLDAAYRLAAREEMLRSRVPTSVTIAPPSLADALQRKAALIVDTTATGADQRCRLDALEATPGGAYTPILFCRDERITTDDKLHLAFAASILGQVQGPEPDAGRIVHGPQYRSSRVSLPILVKKARSAINQIRVIRESATPPPMVLNRHCSECEFRQSCRGKAVEKDDLSLLRGLPAKEIAGLNKRGIFTVNQFSHTFRPGRLKRVKETGAKHEHALQALALREKKVYIARRPKLPDSKVRAYLDVEGLPDRDFYYLVGLSVEEGGGMRRSSLWADREVDERSIWNQFLEIARGLGNDFVIYHYGSYEKHFLERMEDRYGGDSELIARLKSKAVNVLSAIHAQVYFPSYANDLKSIAGCLGFKWSRADASGLQSIVWRHNWEETGDEVTKERLLTYNLEDCSALEHVTAAVQLFGADSPPAATAGVSVAGIEEIKKPVHRKYGNSTFAIPAFESITKCAYFDYQRNKILCRINPGVKASIARKKRTRSRVYQVNKEIQCARPSACPQCGSGDLKAYTSYNHSKKVVIDLKLSRSGIKRWITRYKTKRYRCQACWATCTSQEYPVHPGRYGSGLCGWALYSVIAQRQTHESIVETLHDQFGIVLPASHISTIRQLAAERYRASYESLLSALRAGSLVHADETKVEIKGVGNANVWAFASPDTAVYVYSPTREGTTLTETLKGFKGVLVSDFYAVYDSAECSQQKCLVHLIRDLNDDLLKHPFDEELKQIAAQFTAVLQPVISTIDRFGLKKYYLGKHKPAVEQFFTAMSKSEYRSELAQYYQTRFLKNRNKLFTFLDHDGVPWNNNNAENAVKLFASRRKVMGNLFTERGIKDYLLLLSLYQTLRYRGLSFWKFLMSGETDIAAFTAKSR